MQPRTSFCVLIFCYCLMGYPASCWGNTYNTSAIMSDIFPGNEHYDVLEISVTVKDSKGNIFKISKTTDVTDHGGNPKVTPVYWGEDSVNYILEKLNEKIDSVVCKIKSIINEYVEKVERFYRSTLIACGVLLIFFMSAFLTWFINNSVPLFSKKMLFNCMFSATVAIWLYFTHLIESALYSVVIILVPYLIFILLNKLLHKNKQVPTV